MKICNESINECMPIPDEIHWKGASDEIVLSPLKGGRITSWKHGPAGEELVKTVGLEEGGLLRMMLGEERYPGTSYNTPHLTHVLYNDERGFSVRLRHFWNASNAIARQLGWNDKVNPVYLDGLLLDKTVTFDAGTSSLLADIAITNTTNALRNITPWMQSHFHGWVRDAFIVSDGKKKDYVWHDIYWAGNKAETGTPMRLVDSSGDGKLHAVLGADTECLAGMASYTHLDFGENSTDGCMELRGKIVSIAPHHTWKANAFISLTDGIDSWQRWATAAPKPLESQISPASKNEWTDSLLLPILRYWALPEEHDKGLFILSHLDKIPFTSASRYSAANSFSCFHHDKTGKHARASAVLMPFRKFENISIECIGDRKWHIMPKMICTLEPYAPVSLILEGPADLKDKETIEIRISEGKNKLAVLRIEPDAAVSPQYPFQVKQASTYLDERWHAEKGGFHGSSAEDFRAWQTRTRKYLVKWMNDAVTGPAPLSPRIMERQVGPHCIREKILIQTEHDLWIPMYLVRPKETPPGKRLPAIFLPHGSCSGKLLFVPDETEEMQNVELFDKWPLPYQFAHQLGCIVLTPDRRGWGEWSEANHGQRWQRAWNAGYNMIAMDIWDQVKAIDYLMQRTDVDANRIISMGSSGGGLMTTFLMGADERVAGGIVSSSLTMLPLLPDQYFFQKEQDGKAIIPPCEIPLAHATILCLAAPRPLWIMDGKDDPCYALHDKLQRTAEERRAAFARWRVESNAGREEAARTYRLSGSEGNLQTSWFEGEHLAGFTFNNISGWLEKNFNISAGKNI